MSLQNKGPASSFQEVKNLKVGQRTTKTNWSPALSDSGDLKSRNTPVLVAT